MNSVTKEDAQGEEAVDLLTLLGILFRYRGWLLVINVPIIAGIVGLSILSLILPASKSPLPNKYRAHALILIQQGQAPGLTSILSTSGLGSLAGLAGITAEQSYGDIAIKLLSSKSNLDVIAGEFRIAERYNIRKHQKTESRRLILKYSGFLFDKRTNTVSITFEDYVPLFASQVVNRMVEILDQRFATIGENQNVTRKNLLENKLAEVLVEMSLLEEAIQDFQLKYGVLTIEELATEQIAVLARLRSQLILKELEINTYSDFSKVDDPVLKRLKSERDNLLRLLREVEEGFSSYEKIMPPQKQLPGLAVEFAHLKRDLTVQEKVYEILTQQYELTKLEVEAAEPVFQILELAEPPDKKSGPSRSVICIATTITAFFSSIIIVFIINAVKNIRKDPAKLRKLRGIDR